MDTPGCPRCDKPCRSVSGVKVKIHYVMVCRKCEEVQAFVDTVTARMHTVVVHKQRQKERVTVKCEGTILKNCFHFKYLGSMFAGGGTEGVDIRRRVGMAISRCGQLRFVLEAKGIDVRTKMKMHECGVGSLFTCGSEAWSLSVKCMRQLNGASAVCLSRFSDKTRVEESRETTCSYSLVNDIRRRRLVWLMHILRMDSERLVKRACRIQCEMGREGNILMDSPKNLSYEELEALARDRVKWRGYVKSTFGR